MKPAFIHRIQRRISTRLRRTATATMPLPEYVVSAEYATQEGKAPGYQFLKRIHLAMEKKGLTYIDLRDRFCPNESTAIINGALLWTCNCPAMRKPGRSEDIRLLVADLLDVPYPLVHRVTGQPPKPTRRNFL